MKEQVTKSSSGEVLSIPDLRVIEDIAALWVMRLEDDDLSADQRQQLQVWLRESDRHSATFDRLAALWGVLDSVEVLADYQAANDRTNSARVSWQPTWWMATAASLLLVVFGTLALLDFDSAPTEPGYVYANSFVSGIGEQKLIEMPDGSRINLNTDSLLQVTYSASAREVYLLRGEAYFNVAKDAQRPFSVATEQGLVIAVGTAFTVRVYPEAMDLVVVEGVVSVSSNKSADKIASVAVASAAPSGTVSAGQSVIFDGSVRLVEEVPLPVIERKLAWREGLLDFDGEPLSDVLNDIGRYTELIIEIEDEALGALPVAGRFKIGEIDALLEALEIMIGVQVQHIAPGHVRLLKAG